MIKVSLQKCITDRNLTFHSWLQELKEIRKLKVDKEIQINDWFLTSLEYELDQLNFKTSREFHHNNFSLFGKSRPDFTFFKKDRNWIKAGMIIQPPSELTAVNICDAALEFKLDIAHNPQRVYPQAIADMVRVANDLMVDALSVGKVVDEVVIYALLIAYDKKNCIPLKYLANFKNSSYEIFVGQEARFHEIFTLLAFSACNV